MVVLGITTIISYGATQYLFGVLVVPLDAWIVGVTLLTTNRTVSVVQLELVVQMEDRCTQEV